MEMVSLKKEVYFEIKVFHYLKIHLLILFEYYLLGNPLSKFKESKEALASKILQHLRYPISHIQIA